MRGPPSPVHDGLPSARERDFKRERFGQLWYEFSQTDGGRSGGALRSSSGRGPARRARPRGRASPPPAGAGVQRPTGVRGSAGSLIPSSFLSARLQRLTGLLTSKLPV